MPGSPASSWAVYRARLKAVFHGADPRVCAAFWLFGLINNVLYVIILSAALDLVGPNVPKGVVLLADVIPSFLAKLCAPYFIHKIPYNVRIVIFVTLSVCGMLIIALTPPLQDSGTIAIKMCGVMLASLSSGAGELSFLGLTHYYGHFALASWGSGTGGAGLIGAGAYAIATNTLGITPRTSLLVFSFLPQIMVLSFFIILPLGPLRAGIQKQGDYEAIDDHGDDEEEEVGPAQEQDDLLSSSMHSASGRSFPSVTNTGANSALSSFRANLSRARGLFFPYMLPLLLVYIAEYTINQGVAPTLLFPLESSPFDEYRSFYSTYGAIYQVGVFISRSSTPFIRIHHLYVPSFLQVANLIVLALHAMFNFIPSYYIVCVIIFWEGLLGGLVYVSTFAEITDNVPKEDREFSLGATSVSDSGGICIAGFLGMAVEFTTKPAETEGVFSTLSCATSDTECDTDSETLLDSDDDSEDRKLGQQEKVLPQYHITGILVGWQPDKDFIASYPAQIIGTTVMDEGVEVNPIVNSSVDVANLRLEVRGRSGKGAREKLQVSPGSIFDGLGPWETEWDDMCGCEGSEDCSRIDHGDKDEKLGSEITMEDADSFARSTVCDEDDKDGDTVMDVDEKVGVEPCVGMEYVWQA
ncbi:battenin CLN3 protein [Alternaria infectoria]|uniref:battenin CLN3 protein n=1 Tax=Alternaria infectoria TaxID=45303 RepID=UPI00221E9C20|nr:battenin CLN3 protein [Alternaria infectoria]KAI4933877.1 battenin CLN3 protein [Alternaria infectoria]